VSTTPEEHFRAILQALGEDVTREGLQDTPRRYVKFMREFLAPEPFKFTTFEGEDTDEMVVVSNIPFFSLCEHHTAPFFGTATVAYIPNGRIVGLSKIPRLVDHYARRFQNQERITSQVALHMDKELSPLGVGVCLRAQHLCVAMRGVKKHDTWTTTTKLLGAIKMSDAARAEFLARVQ
jgi:GTP cyclohydrolase IA